MANTKRAAAWGTELPDEIAGQVLANAFHANGLPENSVPLESLLAYSNYRHEKFVLQRVLSILMFIVFLLVPLLFVLPHSQMTEAPELSEPGRPAYLVTVSGLKAVSAVKAVIDEVSMPVYQEADGVYSVRPTANGEMTVTVRLYNDQFETHTAAVTGVDTKAPELRNYEVKDGLIWLYPEDAGTGVDFENSYALAADGSRVEPVSTDAEAGVIVYEFPEAAMNLYLFDYAQNRAQFVISPKKGAGDA